MFRVDFTYQQRTTLNFLPFPPHQTSETKGRRVKSHIQNLSQQKNNCFTAEGQRAERL